MCDSEYSESAGAKMPVGSVSKRGLVRSLSYENDLRPNERASKIMSLDIFMTVRFTLEFFTETCKYVRAIFAHFSVKERQSLI